MAHRGTRKWHERPARISPSEHPALAFLRKAIERHARGVTNESGAQPEASEDVPRHIRDVIGEALAGRSLELANLKRSAALAAREPLIKAHLGGDSHEALLALRATQGDRVGGHVRISSPRLLAEAHEIADVAGE